LAAVDQDTVLVVGRIGDFILPARFEATVIRDDNRGDFETGDFNADWPPITMQIEVRRSALIVTALTIGAHAELSTKDSTRKQSAARVDEERHAPHPITGELLRQMPVARLAKYAALGVARHMGDGPIAEPVVPDEIRSDSGFYRIGPDQIPDNYGVHAIDEPQWPDLWSSQMQTFEEHAAPDRRPPQTRRNRVTDEILAQVAQVYRQAIRENVPPKKAVRTTLHLSEATAGRYIQRARQHGFLGKTQPGKKGELSG
jgi:hypothetical protein